MFVYVVYAENLSSCLIQTTLMTWSRPFSLIECPCPSFEEDPKQGMKPRSARSAKSAAAFRDKTAGRGLMMPRYEPGCTATWRLHTWNWPDGANLPARTQSCELSSGALAVLFLWPQLMQPRPASDLRDPTVEPKDCAPDWDRAIERKAKICEVLRTQRQGGD